jgi:hypothetical protein
MIRGLYSNISTAKFMQGLIKRSNCESKRDSGCGNGLLEFTLIRTVTKNKNPESQYPDPEWNRGIFQVDGNAQLFENMHVSFTHFTE